MKKQDQTLLRGVNILDRLQTMVISSPVFDATIFQARFSTTQVVGLTIYGFANRTAISP